MENHLVVIDLVADIRRRPSDAQGGYVHDDLQETQVLYNEVLIYRDQLEGWFYVEAAEQKKFVQSNVLQGYPGWIRKDSAVPTDASTKRDITVKNINALIRKDLQESSDILLIPPIGSRFTVKQHTDEGQYQVLLPDGRTGWINDYDVARFDEMLPEEILRRNISDTAGLFLGTPYLWGGRSVVNTEPTFNVQGSTFNVNSQLTTHASQLIAGVDCSSLTNLVFRINNIDIPRDAHDQWLAAERISPDELKPGDLVFVSESGNSDRIIHVMLYLGEECFVEALETGSVVQTGTFKDRFHAGLSVLSDNDFKVDDKKVYFGRVLNAR